MLSIALANPMGSNSGPQHPRVTMGFGRVDGYATSWVCADERLPGPVVHPYNYGRHTYTTGRVRHRDGEEAQQ